MFGDGSGDGPVGPAVYRRFFDGNGKFIVVQFFHQFFLALVLALIEILTFLSYFVVYRYADCNFLRAGFNIRRNYCVFAGTHPERFGGAIEYRRGVFAYGQNLAQIEVSGLGD